MMITGVIYTHREHPITIIKSIAMIKKKQLIIKHTTNDSNWRRKDLSVNYGYIGECCSDGMVVFI